MATTIPIACIDVDLGQEVLLSVPCRSDPVGPLRHSYCLYHAIHRLRPAQRHTPYVTHVSTEVWPYPRCEVVSSEQGANRVLHLLLEYLIDLLLQLLPHRFQGLRHLLLELFQDRLEGLRNLLLQRRAQELPDPCRLSCLLCLLLCLGRHYRLLAAWLRCGTLLPSASGCLNRRPGSRLCIFCARRATYETRLCRLTECPAHLLHLACCIGGYSSCSCRLGSPAGS